MVHLHLECGVGRGIELRADIGGIDLINGVDTTVQSQGRRESCGVELAAIWDRITWPDGH